jgi:sugar phosphate isomerase/epimerase
LVVRQDQIALQLYTVRRLAADDLPGTLRAVAEAGYRAVELAGLPHIPSADLARLLRDNGLRPVAAHESLDSLRADIDAVTDRMRELDCPRVIVPSLPEVDRHSPDAVRHVAAELGQYARTVAEEGMRLGYHNHAVEFARLDGTTTWDVLLQELPPEVELEIDVYWAAYAGRDPATEIRAAGDRVRLLHMKDLVADPDPRDAPAGQGTLPFADIVAAGTAARVEWYIAEQDEPRDALADIATAFRNLSGLAR